MFERRMFPSSPSEEERKPEDLNRRANEQRKADRGRGGPQIDDETAPEQPLPSERHAIRKDEPQRPGGPGYPAS